MTFLATMSTIGTKSYEEKKSVSVLSEIGLAAYQRMSIEVLVFRIPSETYSLLDSGGEWEPFVITDCPAIYGDLVGLDACGTLNSVDRFTEAGSATHRLPSPTFEPHGPLVESPRSPKVPQV